MPENNDNTIEGVASAEHEPSEAVEFRVEITPPDSYVYSNISGITTSPWDVRINFADASPTSPEDLQIKATTGIVMTPEHAAGLALLLNRQLLAYEQNYGSIRHPQWQLVRQGAEEQVRKQRVESSE